MLTAIVLLMQPLTGLIHRLATDKYEYQEDLKRKVGFFRGEDIVIGTFDRDGGFHQSGTVKPLKIDGESSSLYVLRSVDFMDASMVLQYRQAKVFELRSGMLIPGQFAKNGLFVPEDKGKIIKFADYTYNELARPIWNLPGKYVKKPK